MKRTTYLMLAAVLMLNILLVTACGGTNTATANEDAMINPSAAMAAPENRESDSEAVNVPAAPADAESGSVTLPDTAVVAAPFQPLMQHEAILTADVPLSETDVAGLVFMREEEKLAHDVYVALYDARGLPVFQNIAASEQTHTDSVLSFLNAYDLADPAAGLGPGEFDDQTLQSLYDELVIQGAAGSVEALRVGAAIEEIDILDLDARIAATDNADLVQLYDNLRRGSENHLRAFVSNLARQGSEAYVPQYMSQAMFDEIMAGETGNNGQGNGRAEENSGNQGAGSGSSDQEAGNRNGRGGRDDSGTQGSGNGRGYRGGRSG